MRIANQSMAPLFYRFILCLLCWVHTLPRSAADDALATGQVLAADEKLVSSNGKFALGFFQPDHSPHGGRWYLGIWFNKIPVFTTVWVANRDRPITLPELNQTRLEISADGNLVLAIKNHAAAAAGSVIWSTDITGAINGTSALLSNTGNLLLLVVQGPSSGAPPPPPPLWQSFDHPADVVIPGAKFGWNKLTGLNRQVISKKSLVDPGLGSYSVELNGTRGVILMRRDPPKVYWSGLTSPTLIPELRSLLDMDPRTRGLIIPAYVDNPEEEYYIYNSSDESASSFLSLDMSGQIKLNVWSQDKQSWQLIYAQPADPCNPFATCGPFTICNGSSNPICDCMESFSQKSPLDWELGDRSGGCTRNTPLDCVLGSSNSSNSSISSTASSTDLFHPIAHVTIPYNPKTIEDANDRSRCEQACASVCSCTAYSYQNGICSVWHGDLFSVNLNDGIENHSEDVLYIRLAAKELQDLRKNHHRKAAVVTVTVTVVATVSITGFLLLLVIWRNRSRWCGGGTDGSSGGIVAFRYTDLAHATKNFSEKLGSGGFGSVFKGVLNESHHVAVKRLDGARQGEKQFRAEVSSVGIIQHINLVKLIGFCSEGDKRLLVYEHMLNGSLDAHLFQTNAAGAGGGGAVLNWRDRYQIVLGVARGLSYLHESCHECIIHCDIKPENILLDGSFAPKIADFGMAVFVGRDFSRVLTTFRGTAGYLAPEWISGVAVTPKVDVYSFGMVLLEIMSGRRNYSPEERGGEKNDDHVAYFPVRAISGLREGDLTSLVDPRLRGDFELGEAERICKVACWCIQENELDRPAMGVVVRVLEGLHELDLPPMPRLLAAITKCSDVASTQ
ncbi:hypothetical protein GUJ93_ZPchr0004g38450 [Zizania palustris]|uniref:Receptor-like serine/threonine-protein kinase n=1 Tax=Zizania palustris TaxID=103762 RepID=A0A8J5RWC1_ZIZPA|nr:hypothetical protein GUJ93_ZPchr0004g38450 [Zizania palustris]